LVNRISHIIRPIREIRVYSFRRKQMTNIDQPIVCDLTVFSDPVRQQMAVAIPATFKMVQQVQDLPNGYAFQFPNQPGMFMALATFVEHERQCCPFYHLALESEPGGGPFWLRLTGGEGVKEFIQSIWGDFLPMPNLVPGS
jgi:hypothetical protein